MSEQKHADVVHRCMDTVDTEEHVSNTCNISTRELGQQRTVLTGSVVAVLSARCCSSALIWNSTPVKLFPFEIHSSRRTNR